MKTWAQILQFTVRQLSENTKTAMNIIKKQKIKIKTFFLNSGRAQYSKGQGAALSEICLAGTLWLVVTTERPTDHFAGPRPRVDVALLARHHDALFAQRQRRQPLVRDALADERLELGDVGEPRARRRPQQQGGAVVPAVRPAPAPPSPRPARLVSAPPAQAEVALVVGAAAAPPLVPPLAQQSCNNNYNK